MIYLDRMGHLFSDHSLEELYEFAVNKLKLKPEWNHFSRNFPHFDLTTKRKQNEAINLGATKIEETREMLELYNKVKPLYPLTIPHYPCKGIHSQPIMRVDFKKYFQSK